MNAEGLSEEDYGKPCENFEHGSDAPRAVFAVEVVPAERKRLLCLLHYESLLMTDKEAIERFADPNKQASGDLLASNASLEEHRRRDKANADFRAAYAQPGGLAGAGVNKITGYRELSANEIALINHVKLTGSVVGELCDKLRGLADVDQRWVAIARTELQNGFMALARAIAKPESF